MKRLILTLLIISVGFYSCSEDFNPFGDFNEKYVLTCLVKSDTSFQIAYLSKSYFTNSTDPNDNLIDPSILNADVRLWVGDSVYLLCDSSIVRTDSSRYSSNVNFYFNRNVSINYNKRIEIEALLQNGKRLKATSQTPREIYFENESEVLVPPVNKNFIYVFWSSGGETTYYLPKLYFRYIKRENGIDSYHEIEIPLSYRITNNVSEPIFPVPSGSFTVAYNMNAVREALQLISTDDENKSSYFIYQKLKFKVITMDQHLTRYYSSTSKSFEDLTVRVNENDYTNIDGGLGIFASYFVKPYDKLRFDRNFIVAFGYNFINEN